MSPAETPKPQTSPVSSRPVPSSSAKLERQLASVGLNRTALLMGAMFLAGIGWMLLQARPFLSNRGLNQGEDQMNEATVLAGLSQMSMQVATHQNQPKDSSAAAESFKRESRRAQIAIEDLAGNPFIAPRVKEIPVVVAPVVTTKPAFVDVPPVDHLRLEAILMGASPSAMISGQLLTEGQMIDKWRVIEISPGRVVLQWQDRKHVLKKSQ